MKTIGDLISADPGLPNPNGTAPFWLEPLDALAGTQSPQFPTTSDVVIVGSGITALSVARTLLESDKTGRVVVLEARTLCSGATGRNGGHLINPFPLTYSKLKRQVGKESALKILKFSARNVQEVAALAETFAAKESEIRPVTRLRIYTDQSTMQAEKQSIQEYETDYPEDCGRFKFIGAETCSLEHGIQGVLGAATFQGFAIWPYRFIMRMWEDLHTRYRSKLCLEAFTPALQVLCSGEKGLLYRVSTPRGSINANCIIHCTNAWSSHLIPELRGRIFPYLECMTVQALEGSTRKGHKNTWSFHEPPRYVPEVQGVSNGWTYLQQNAHTGLFLFGGVIETGGNVLSADDSWDDVSTAQYLREKLKTHLGDGSSEAKLLSSWTGCIARTSDTFPVLGQIGGDMFSRPGHNEWIAAGFNGGGMALCWLSGKAIAEQVMGQDVSKWLPKEFELNVARCKKDLTVDNAKKAVDYLDFNRIKPRQSYL